MLSLTQVELEALLLSLRIAAVAVLLSLPLAFACAYLLARGRFPGRLLLDGAVHLPLVLPPVVMGYLLLVLFGTKGPIGGWLLETFNFRFIFNWTGAALAAGIVTFPFQVRAIRLALEAIDPGLEVAAETLGAGWFDRLLGITLPLAIYTALQSPGGEQAAARLATLSIILALAGLLLSEVVARRLRRRMGR